MMKIEFLFWEDCPSYPNALERLKGILDQMEIRAELDRIEVNTDEEAVRLVFPGSPTIRINGRDIDPEGAREQRVGLSCRIYHDSSGQVTSVPPEEMIRAAVEKAREKE